MRKLQEGQVIADRFEIGALAGRGGVGAVFQAFDRQQKARVALKVLAYAEAPGEARERFAREAHVLAEIRHPGIVSYVAFGETEDSCPFLAMEWLSGEDLASRLARGPLDVAESALLVRIVAEALSVAHRKGIVHRDLKPSNIFLRDGRIDRATIIDFGIARRIAGARPITRSDALVGTPAYMAPEQARGGHDVTASTDIFGLGCVLYTCLRGEPPFLAENISGILARILFDTPAPLATVREDVPAALSDLVDRMLAKDPAGRPRDAEALHAEISAVERACADPRSIAAGSRAAINDREQQIFSVIFAAPPPAPAPGEDDGIAGLDDLLAPFDARAERMADGSLVVAISRHMSARDLVTQAARCAMILHDRWPSARVALATGKGILQRDLPVGAAVDRAAHLARATPEDGEAEASDGAICLDDLSANLLEGRFALSRSTRGAIQLGEPLGVDGARRILGRPTACVGRERELGFLEATLRHAADESVAQAVLLTAAAGVGKTRLRHELVRRLEEQGTSVTILLGAGDPIGAVSLYGILGQAIRRRAGVQGGDPPDAQRDRLGQHLGALNARDDTARITEFLAEMCGIPPTSDPSPRLRAARHDPRLMSEQVTHAVVDWLRLECADRPVLLILEDMHWSDALSVNIVDAALRDLSDRPLMVLGLGRPEVKDLFHRPWSDRGLKEIALAGLTRRASERLAQQVLGKASSAEAAARIAAQADGNALYLEELARAVVEGKGGELPETVLAMLEARLARLPAGARRVLRAASVFGEIFWRGGVAALLGEAPAEAEIDRWLDFVVDAEVIEARHESRYPAEIEYAFRHALMRDAAHDMLTEEDAARGHRLASLYLEGAGERDPMILAEHARRGGDTARAAPLYVQATDQAFRCHDWRAVQQRAELGAAAGASAEALGIVLVHKAWALHNSDAQVSAGYSLGKEGLTLLRPGSLDWCRALALLFTGAALHGDMDYFGTLVTALLSNTPDRGAEFQYLEAAMVLILMFSVIGQRGPASAVLARAEAVGAAITAHDVGARGLLAHGRAAYLVYLMPDPWGAVEVARRAVRDLAEADCLMPLTLAQMFLGMALAAIGDRREAVETLQGAMNLAQRRSEGIMVASTRINLAGILIAANGEAEEDQIALVRDLCRPVIDGGDAGAALVGHAHGFLGRALLGAGDLAGAEVEVRAALGLHAPLPALKVPHFATLIHVLLRRGRAEEAREVAKEGIDLLEAIGGTGTTEVDLRCSAALAFQEAGDREGARRAIEEAARQVQIRAETIVDPAARGRFLAEVPENARALALLRAIAPPDSAITSARPQLA